MSLENLKGTEREKEGRKEDEEAKRGLQSQVNWYEKKSSFDLVSVLIVLFIFI